MVRSGITRGTLRATLSCWKLKKDRVLAKKEKSPKNNHNNNNTNDNNNNNNKAAGFSLVTFINSPLAHDDPCRALTNLFPPSCHQSIHQCQAPGSYFS